MSGPPSQQYKTQYSHPGWQCRGGELLACRAPVQYTCVGALCFMTGISMVLDAIGSHVVCGGVSVMCALNAHYLLCHLTRQQSIQQIKRPTCWWALNPKRRMQRACTVKMRTSSTQSALSYSGTALHAQAPENTSWAAFWDSVHILHRCAKNETPSFICCKNSCSAENTHSVGPICDTDPAAQGPSSPAPNGFGAAPTQPAL